MREDAISRIRQALAAGRWDPDREDVEILLEEYDDYEASFTLYDGAIRRADKLWRAAHPDQPLTLPDTASEITWLLELVDRAEAASKPSGLDSVTLTHKQYAQMYDHMAAEYPNECCGMVSGRNGVAKQVYPLRNVARYPLYEIHPDDLVTAVNIELAGDDLLAIYHSHPHSQAIPSGIDIAQAHYPESAYIIVSGLSPMARPESAQVRAWRIPEMNWNSVREIPIVVVDGSARVSDSLTPVTAESGVE